jgi:hypothetical protein
MGGFAILDVAIGLALVYLLLSLLCTTVMEWIAQLRNLRGQALVDGVRALLGESAGASPVTDAVFNHALIDGLSEGDRRPSYIPSSVFAKTLKDVLAKAPVLVGANEAASVDSGVQPSAKLQETLRTLDRVDGGDLETAGVDASGTTSPSTIVVATWFDHAMDRVSGSYKRTTQRIVLLLGLAMAIALNANSLWLTTMLWQNPTLREYMVERAKVRLEQGRPLETVEYADPTTPMVTLPISRDTSSKSPDRLLADEQAMLGQIFSWSGEPARIAQFRSAYGSVRGVVAWLAVSLLGWIVTALAVSLGAPFWFDTLSQFMRVRSTGDVPAKTTGNAK